MSFKSPSNLLSSGFGPSIALSGESGFPSLGAPGLPSFFKSGFGLPSILVSGGFSVRGPFFPVPLLPVLCVALHARGGAHGADRAHVHAHVRDHDHVRDACRGAAHVRALSCSGRCRRWCINLSCGSADGAVSGFGAGTSALAGTSGLAGASTFGGVSTFGARGVVSGVDSSRRFKLSLLDRVCRTRRRLVTRDGEFHSRVNSSRIAN